MTETLIVRRWSRYGADRLYVTAQTGQRLGSVDLISGEVVAESPQLEEGLRRAAQEYLRNDVDEVMLDLPLAVAAQPTGAVEGVQDGEVVPLDVPVGARLDRLAADGWTVLHDVPLGRQGDTVQHLVAGPGGVYALAVHIHPGADVLVNGRSLYVSGRAMPYLRNAAWQAQRIERVLGAAASSFVTVRGVVVVHTGALSSPRIEKMPDDALVLGRTDIPGVFRRLPRRLTDDEVATLADAMGRRNTWTEP